jgi:prepilin-type N-terminal cleavage/methylation domain-containing protein
MKKQNGFTLIELLVVIAIIALLSSVVLATLATARSKARDSRRVADIQQLMNALELYNDANGRYPVSNNCGATVPRTDWCNSAESLSAGRWIRDNGTTGVLSPYLPKDPTDPAPQTIGVGTWPVVPGVYFYFSNTATTSSGVYYIVFKVENSPNPLESNGGVTNCGGTTLNYGTGSNGVITVGQSCSQ